MKKIRLLGIILIAGGYIWLMLWFSNAAVPLPRAIFKEADAKYPATRTYSQSELLDAVTNASRRWQDNALGIVIPSTLMLLGGVFGCRGSKVPS